VSAAEETAISGVEPIEWLLSLPPACARQLAAIAPDRARSLFAASDPPGRQLGSGGGTAHLLRQAWQAAAAGRGGFGQWLRASRKLLIHGSGESRRLPAYAAAGKPLIPIPPVSSIGGQRPDQILLDMLCRSYAPLLWHAPDHYRTMIACGDSMVRAEGPLPLYPRADVLIVGLAAPPEEAEHHGVMICAESEPWRLQSFLQKPPADSLLQLAANRPFYLDTGVWLLSERAVMALMGKCGWNDGQEDFEGGAAREYDLYGRFGPLLGESPRERDPEIGRLTSAVLPLDDARFYHFGTNRSLLASVRQLQHPSSRQRSFGHASMSAPVAPVVQHAQVDCPLGPDQRDIWIENARIPAGWRLARRHVLTNVPPNEWSLELESGVCLDFAPVNGGGTCVRFYGFDDALRGPLGDGNTRWLGRPAPAWFAARGISPPEAGCAEDADIFDARLFPVLAPADLAGDFVAWLCAASPPRRDDFRRLWNAARRLSARELLHGADCVAMAAQRRDHLRRALRGLDGPAWLESCARLDLAATAGVLQAENLQPPALPAGNAPATLASVHDRMCRAALLRRGDAKAAEAGEASAFAGLRDLIVGQMELRPVRPRRNALEDQIVWGRAPVRLDLGGGWSDTPPFCLEHGGMVVNVAADLNGQPPIQVFARISDKPGIALHSIDLGIGERLETYDDIRGPARLGSGFGIARAALALVGFDPRFHAKGGYASLKQHLAKELGGGIELSMVSAVPKGSGLGTSSILAATVLGSLGELCGLNWNTCDLFARTLALEQILTSGGGWQDQAGGLLGGIKVVETVPALVQRPVIRWLPDRFFGEDYANRTVLLYYTGITRVAHSILGEIVRAVFLNSGAHLGIIEAIRQNAAFLADAVQRHDWNGLCEGIRRSWMLNQRLDGGTNPPEVQAIVDRVADLLEANKLLGAGGGGYMLFLAKDPEAASRVRAILGAEPPNPRARFVDLGLSRTGFKVTRS